MTLARVAVLGAILALWGCGDASHNAEPANAGKVTVHGGGAAQADAYTDVVQQLYVAFFGRPGDPAGVSYYIGMLRANHAPTDMRGLANAYASDRIIRTIINDIADSPEAKVLYGSAPSEMIASLYLQSFNRDADDAGFAWWLARIAQGDLNSAAAVMAILASAQEDDLATFRRKVDAALAFTAEVSLPSRHALYANFGSVALARALLANVSSHSSDETIKASVDAAIAALQGHQAYVITDGYAEVPAGARRVALLVAADQLETQGARLATLATVLAADLNGRSGQYGPKWTVAVQQAADSVTALRAQLLGTSGAILIGNVPVPTRENGTVPDLDPYRLPECTRYRFPTGSQIVEPPSASDHIWVSSEDPACRNGSSVALLRGTSRAVQGAEIGAKLDQMIAYHRASDQQNAGWSARYQHVNALWLGAKPGAPDTATFWNNIPLYSAAQASYLDSGNSAVRMAAFRACLDSNAEMCAFNGHGSSNVIMAEGPDPTRDFYSSDALYLYASSLRERVVRAKFVNLQSCSTQNFLQDDSFATTLLASGQTLLTLGSSAVAFQSSWGEKNEVETNYQSLAYGATFADAFVGKLDATPLSFQGDPFISLRPKPDGAQPKLVLDGKHYNVHPAIVTTTFGDSVNAALVVKTFTIKNGGAAPLHLRLSVMPEGVTATGQVLSPAGNTLGGLGFPLVSPAATDVSGFGNVGNIVHVVNPNESFKLRLGFQARRMDWLNPTLGQYSGKYEIYSNDPASPRIIFELRGTAK